MVGTRTFESYIRLGWKGMARTNTLAYWAHSNVTKKVLSKEAFSIILLHQKRFVILRFFCVSWKRCVINAGAMTNFSAAFVRLPFVYVTMLIAKSLPAFMMLQQFNNNLVLDHLFVSIIAHGKLSSDSDSDSTQSVALTDISKLCLPWPSCVKRQHKQI